MSPPFSYLFNILPSSPVTPLRSSFGPYREKAASRYRNGWVAFGERLEVFRETVELSLWISGKGSMPVQERRRTGIARGRGAATHL
ncbi:hypothetical protein AGA28_24940 [Escherichia coli]|nr:hypothetical protein AGA28_24940 [Escherichia coli]